MMVEIPSAANADGSNIQIQSDFILPGQEIEFEAGIKAVSAK
jgi:hypothetical protein